MTSSMDEKQIEAKKYSRIKITLSIAEMVFTVLFILGIIMFGISRNIESMVNGYVQNPYLVLLGFVLVLGLLEKIIWLPVDFYSGYILEHNYKLSNQSIAQWVRESLKALGIGIVLFTPLLLIFYYFLRNYGAWWWLPVATVFFIFSVVLAQLAPILIMPLFYKFTPLQSDELKEKLITMCGKVGFSIKGVFRFNMSKDTKKANAALTGLGKTRRIILADTLLDNFSGEEIESVFAHEIGHYVHRHMWKLMALGMVLNYCGLFITSKLYALSLIPFNFSRIDEVAALPLLTLLLSFFGLLTMPVQNIFSRRMERQADRYSFTTQGDVRPFISAMEKLAEMNLGDKSPHPLIETLFYSHPSIQKRIHHAHTFLQTQPV